MEQKYKVEQIFTKNYARLCAMTTAILHDSSLAQDAVQEGWIRLHKAKQLDTSSEEKLEHLILITVRHAAYNIMRKGNPEPIEDSILNSIPDTSPSPHEIVESREVSRKIKNSLRNLSETDRSIIQLQYGQGYTSTQIAALPLPRNGLNFSAKTIFSWASAWMAPRMSMMPCARTHRGTGHGIKSRRRSNCCAAAAWSATFCVSSPSGWPKRRSACINP